MKLLKKKRKGKMMKEDKIRYIELVQSIISRLANNSFLLKGWTITLIAAIFSLSDKIMKNFAFTIYFFILIFWILDSYYLYQERLYRDLYNKVIEIRDEYNPLFSLKIDKKQNEKIISFFKSFFSFTEVTFYLLLLLITFLILKFIH
jgi:hypothetical protein